MTGPLIEFSIKSITPLDANISSVRYDIQVSFVGPASLTTGPYVYRESRTDMVSKNNLFKDTSITQSITYDGSFSSTVASNFSNNNGGAIDAFYERGFNLANAYFANMYGSQTVRGYTGSMSFSGAGISGSLYGSD